MLNWIYRRPKVSVIIATYNWSQALKLSIQSALQQSIKNIEVIVVGDACTDDSEMVTKSFNDKRLRWIGLQTNSGSQAVPNNTGIEHARADLIAYHGHDDIWHPRHLEYLLQAVKTQKADYVYSGAILYGPPDTNIRMLTGFPIGQKIHFAIPPTTTMHKKNLVERIGQWKMNHEATFPIDYDFQFRARHAGVKFANTGKVSAFKFPAAWHRDSYQKKDVTRQSALLNKMRLNPNFLEEELLSVAKAADHGLFIPNQLPTQLEKGEFFAINSGMKGSKPAQDETDAPLETTYYLDKNYYGFEWHALETAANGLTFRWSGPRCESTLTIPIATHQNICLDIHVLQFITSDVMSGLNLFVNNQQITFSIHPDKQLGYRLKANIPQSIASALVKNKIKLTFKVPKTVAPLEFADNDDRRLIGLAVYAVHAKSNV